MASKKIGCSAGKTILVDPNAFDGQDSTSNVSVPLEDLNISVQLETNRKARTVLTTQNNGKETLNVGESSKRVTIRFIEGSEVNGKKVLTTKYTDLTTSFDDGNNNETLGITDIDIDFNSSYAPMITIKFIDIRGSAIFQNEENISNGENKYATFFQLPYPIYALTIKGYYGMPVKYCLHMTKFNSRFNSQTGNFEITANFIGYTYAMLSDMLLGYLKAIEYTKLGAAKYLKLKETQPNLLTLNELMVAISRIDVDTQRIKATDPDAADLNNGVNKLSQLESVETNILILGQNVDLNKNLDKYEFIVSAPNTDDDIKNKISKYVTNVTESVKVYNTGNDITLITEDFTNINSKQYSGLSLRLLSLETDSDPNFSEQIKLNKLQTILGEQKDFNKTRVDLYKYVTKNYDFGFEYVFNVFDIRKQYDILKATTEKIEAQMKNLTTTLAKTLGAAVNKTLGFDPTIRNIIKIFTTSVEVFLSVLYDVSAAALVDEDRKTQLKKFTEESYDIKNKSIGSSPTNTPTGPLTPLYYPWPDYRVDDEHDGLIETYLGKAGVLDRPSDVNELAFINELLKAFLTAQSTLEQAQLAITEELTNWFPINPLDTRLFINTHPYKRIEGNSRTDVMTLLLIRAMTYLGFSNKGLTPEEIQAMANIEADGVLSDIANDKIIQSLTQISVDEILSTSNTINAKDTNVIKELSGNYYYDYIFDSSGNTLSGAQGFKVIPINKQFVGNWSPLNNDLVEDSSNGNLFLTNYSTTANQDGGGSWLYKPNDGGVYIKMITKDVYYGQTAYPLVSNETKNDNVLDLSKLKLKPSKFPIDGSGVGFNQFGGAYGFQEYVNLNYGVTDLESAPFMFMFYQDANYGSKTFNKTNGVGFKRSVSGVNGNPTSSVYDITKSTFRVAETINDVMKYIDGDEALHAQYGKNRNLLNKVKKGSQDISYPFINFQVEYDTEDGNNLAPVSLFGSRLYYEQTNNYAKALLFLHTFPWNGLITVEEEDSITNLFATTANNTIFDKNEIINTFANRAGFISAPKIWAAFIGGLLWRADGAAPMKDSTGRQISGGSGVADPILFRNLTESFIPTFNVKTKIPTKIQYLTKSHGALTTEQGKDFQNTQMTFSNNSVVGHEYKSIDSMLLVLPEQAKEEFKKIFFEFVVSSEMDSLSDWDKIKNQLEIFKGTGAQWVTAYNTTLAGIFNDAILDEMVLNTTTTRITYSVVNNGVNSFNNYIVFTPLIDDDDFKYNYLLEIKDGTQASKTLMDIFTNEIIIANMSYKIWEGNDINDTKLREGVFVNNTDLKIYLDVIVDKFTKNKDILSSQNKKKEKEREIFGTDDENLIKLQLYRTCKNIYDKWIGGSTSGDDLVFQGACGGRNAIDLELAKKARGSSASETLIDSFRFVTRSFRDIGDELIINPVPVNEFLRNNSNSSFYDAVTSLLSANNFDFIPLPTYINYGDAETLETMFKPVSGLESFSQGTVGPAFVCVYLGQKSKHLDFKDSEYTNDGFDVHCDGNGNIKPGLPKDFSTSKELYENNVAVFAVNYGQQNQNIFKDITLDQSEFSETAESLQIIDDISKKGSENNKSLAGQNLYNVYSVRSYKTEVEMMGNAMIQPMMYFQLNNIPMFHGAYMITHVKHSIKPNSMSTNFTGVRIRKPETQLMDKGELFMSLLDSVDSSNIKQVESTRNFGSTSGNISGKFIMPNTVSVADLKNKINDNKFNAYLTKDTKFTKYGTN